MSAKSARTIFSENLQRLMRNKNVDQKELAETIGVTQPTISNWIKEIKYPRIKRIQLLADFFNVPKSELTEEHSIVTKNAIVAYITPEVTEEEVREIINFIEYIKAKEIAINKENAHLLINNY